MAYVTTIYYGITYFVNVNPSKEKLLARSFETEPSAGDVVPPSDGVVVDS